MPHGMREASRLAARRPERGGLPNALFVLAAAENLPTELDGRIDELQIALPWGSLLRGVACAEPWLVDAMHRVLRPAAEVRILLSVTDRDSALGLSVIDARSLDALAATYRALDSSRTRCARRRGRRRASGSGWARRLDIPLRRPAWYLRLRRAGPGRGNRRRGRGRLGATPGR